MRIWKGCLWWQNGDEGVIRWNGWESQCRVACFLNWSHRYNILWQVITSPSGCMWCSSLQADSNFMHLTNWEEQQCHLLSLAHNQQKILEHSVSVFLRAKWGIKLTQLKQQIWTWCSIIKAESWWREFMFSLGGVNARWTKPGLLIIKHLG